MITRLIWKEEKVLCFNANARRVIVNMKTDTDQIRESFQHLTNTNLLHLLKQGADRSLASSSLWGSNWWLKLSCGRYLTLWFQSYYLESCPKAQILNASRSSGRWNSWCYKLCETLGNLLYSFQNRNNCYVPVTSDKEECQYVGAQFSLIYSSHTRCIQISLKCKTKKISKKQDTKVQSIIYRILEYESFCLICDICI